MKRGGFLNRTSRLPRGKWKRSKSKMWDAIERECPAMGKGIAERAARDEARAEEEFARKYGSIERVFFVQMARTCAVPGCGRNPCENAHGDEGREGSFKAGYLTIVALCDAHHRTHRWSFHNLGSEEAFERHWLIPHGTTWALEAEAVEYGWVHHGPRYVTEAKESGRFDAWLERRAA